MTRTLAAADVVCDPATAEVEFALVKRLPSLASLGNSPFPGSSPLGDRAWSELPRLRTCYPAHASERVAMRNEHTTNATRQTAPKTTVRVICGTFGIDEPSALIDLGRGAGFRATSAAMHRLAARVEELSTNERWIVQTRADDRYEQRGRVYLELARASAAEVERALAVLRAAVQ